MEMEERCLHHCEYIQTLTGVHTALLNVRDILAARRGQN